MQNLIVGIIVVLAAIYLGRRVYRSVKQTTETNTCGCSCEECTEINTCEEPSPTIKNN